MTVDLCVVNFNTKDKLHRLIDTLYNGDQWSANKNKDPKDWNLYIADNDSKDGSVEYLSESPVPAHVFFNENIGYAKACNELASKGTGDIVGLLNADVWLRGIDVVAIQKLFDEHPEVGILGPKQRDEHGYITHAGIFGTEVEPKMRAWKQHDPHDTQYRAVLEEAITVSGAAYFVRRSIWEELTDCPYFQKYHDNINEKAVGAFLCTPHYFEERACSAHARAHGYKVFYGGRISIGHSWHASHRVGSWQDKLFRVSKKMYQDFCDMHGIEREL